ncbi:MAG: CopG family transcriptional regulator [Chloroflexi bacterium]|nr:CopG family transcriptional regulator [Chloroflexota bacterium]
MAKKTGLRGVDALFGPQKPPKPETEEAPQDRIRTSVYLDPEDVVILDRLQTLLFQRERRRPDRSELIRKALRYYHEAQSSGAE